MKTSQSVSSFIRKILNKINKNRHKSQKEIQFYVVPMKSIKRRSTFGKVKVENGAIFEPTEIILED